MVGQALRARPHRRWGKRDLGEGEDLVPPGGALLGLFQEVLEHDPDALIHLPAVNAGRCRRPG